MTECRGSRGDLKTPLAFCGPTLGLALLSVCLVDNPRVAIAVVTLTILVTLAVLRELIFGDS